MTNASREDVEVSPWNEGILDGVAQGFRDAVLQFCQHPSLQFQWMRFLPSKTVSDQFWSRLLPSVLSILRMTPIFRPHSGGNLKAPSQLRLVPGNAKDEHGDPLFEDLPEELYLSLEYQPSDHGHFEQLGIRRISVLEILERVQADLSRVTSRMKSHTTTDDWHTKSAILLKTPLDGNSSDTRTIYALGIVPLQDKSWVSALDNNIYYPESDGVPVPTDLGLQLIDTKALMNPARRALFSKLGAKDCLPTQVMMRIIGRYTRNENVALESSVAHLRYLYWYLPVETTSLSKFIFIRDHDNIPVYRFTITDGREQVVDDLYFESQDEYGAQQLLSKITEDGEVTAPGYPARFLNPAYLNAISSEVCRNSMPWHSWLQVYASVQHAPRLCKSSGITLSDVFLYLIEYRSDILVEVLKEHWGSYSTLMNPNIKRALMAAPVACEDVCDTPLKDTYMPLTKLMNKCLELGIFGMLPFLDLPDTLDNDESIQRWDFLKSLGVRHKPNIDFYLDVLRQIVRLNSEIEEDLSAATIENIFKIYETIGDCSKESDKGKIAYVNPYLYLLVTCVDHL